MAERPSGFRNFLGGVVDRVLVGDNYNRNTGKYNNVLTGALGTLGGIVGTAMTGNPMVGAGIRMVAGRLIDAQGNDIGPVQKEQFNQNMQPEAPAWYNMQQGNLGFGGGPSSYGPFMGGYGYP